MNSESERHQIWFDNVVQPKLQVLLALSEPGSDLASFDYQAFFKEFLADLELMTLDNYATENQVEKISEALGLLQGRGFDDGQFSLRDIALVASLRSPVDRFLFFGKWQKYKLFKKVHGPVKDEAVVDAFRLPALLRGFVFDIRQRALQVIADPPLNPDAEAS